MKDLKNKGWVRLHRQIEENKLWFSEPFTKAQAWIDLFLNANHKDGSFWVRGLEIKVKRGQIGWSEVNMAKRWTWSRNKVRRFLKLLETEQQIEQQKLYKISTLITIIKYEEYQSDTTDDTTERQQKDNRRYTNKNEKNEKNEKNITAEINSASKEIPELIKAFEEVNPACKRMYGNSTQRKACQDLIDNYGFERVKLVIEKTLKKTNGLQFFPTITTPLQLRDKWSALESAINKKRSEIKKNSIASIKNDL